MAGGPTSRALGVSVIIGVSPSGPIGNRLVVTSSQTKSVEQHWPAGGESAVQFSLPAGGIHSLSAQITSP